MISIIIVNYNTTNLLIKSINSIIENTKSISYEIFVVDNNSKDEDINSLLKEFPDIHIMKNNENVGFGRANNQALKNLRNDFAVLLNPDTFVKNDALTKMTSFMKKNPEVGIAAPRLLYPDGTKQPSWEKNFPGYKYAGAKIKNLPREGLAWIIGACMIVRREAMEDVGSLDEDYFMYGEETDWCLRMRKKGWKVACIPEAEIIHFKAQSASTVEESETLKRRIISEFIFYKKHYPTVSVYILKALKIIKAVWRIPFLYFKVLLKPGDIEAKNTLLKYKVTLKILCGYK